MKVLILTPVIFILSLAVHLAVWKLHLPKNQKRALLGIFLGVFFVALSGIWILSQFAGLAQVSPQSLEYLQIFIFYISMVLTYMVTFSAIEVDSPSLMIVQSITSKGSAGLDKEEFGRMMRDDVLVLPRIKDLVDDGIVYLDSGKYKLAPKGVSIARLFIFYRKLMGIGEKGG